MNTLNNQFINPFAHDSRGKKWTSEKIKEIIDLFEVHKTVIGVARVLAKSEDTVKKILNANGISTPTRKQFAALYWSHCEQLQIPEEQQKIVEMYSSGMSAKEIGSKYNTSTTTIRQIIKQHNAQRNLPKHADKLYTNKDYILNLYKNGKQIAEIAREFNCSSSSVRSFLIKNTNYVVRKKANNPIPIEDIERIYKLHHEQHYTMYQIGKLYNCTAPCVSDFFDKYSIPRRNKNESIRLKNQEETNMLKKLKALRSKKFVKLPSGKNIKVMGYEDAFLKFVFDNDILKEYEIIFDLKSIPYTEDNIKRKYIPDFYVPKYNLIVEIKSSYISKLQGGVHNLLCKRKGVLEAGYDFCLVLDNNFNNFLSKINSKIG